MSAGCLKRKARQRKAKREKKGRQLITFSTKGIYSWTFPLVPVHVATQQGSRLPLIVWRVWELIKAVTVVVVGGPEEHFVDRHRSSLVQRISSVAAILDQLLDHKVVSQEQYDNILNKGPPQNQVRELYSGPLKSSGTRGKDIFLSVLEKLEPLLIKHLRDPLCESWHYGQVRLSLGIVYIVANGTEGMRQEPRVQGSGSHTSRPRELPLFAHTQTLRETQHT